MSEHALDLAAQLILATLYTHYHIDGPVHGVPKGTKPSRIADASRLAIAQAKASQQPALAHYGAANPDIGTVSHEMPADPSAYKASEVYENCVAVLVDEGELLFAYNFKARRNTPSDTSLKEFRKFAYSDFVISDLAIRDVMDSLRSEIRAPQPRGVPPRPGEGLLDSVRTVKVIQPILPPADEAEAAQFHAEMQLMSYLAEAKDRIPRGNYIGVNKPCCANCTRILKRFGVLFAGSHGLKVTNWKTFGSMRAMARTEIAL